MANKVYTIEGWYLDNQYETHDYQFPFFKSKGNAEAYMKRVKELFFKLSKHYLNRSLDDYDLWEKYRVYYSTECEDKSHYYKIMNIWLKELELRD